MASAEGIARRKRKPDGIHRVKNAANHSPFYQFTDEELDADRPPRGARGKAIGMFYKLKGDRQRRLGLQKPKKPKERPEFNIELPVEKERYIRSILSQVSIKAPISVNRLSSPSGTSTAYEASKQKYSHVKDSEFKRRFLKSISSTIHGSLKGEVHVCELPRDPTMDDYYKKQLSEQESSPNYQAMLRVRKKLPAYKQKEEIIKMIETNQVILIEGETGCGKTTQVPQFILDSCIAQGKGSQCRIVCTQPRRISAISIAQRVAEERDEPLGESVGYQIRLEKELCRYTGSVLFCTTGVILQWLQSQPLLNYVSHIILDEIHERDTTSDFLLALLKDIMHLRPDLKIILMSATLNAGSFSKYFFKCPSVHIPGFTFAVKEFYLEDVLTFTGFDMQLPPQKHSRDKDQQALQKRNGMFMPYIRNNTHKYSRKVLDTILDPRSEEISLDLIFELISYICVHKPPGAILVFLPGWDRISNLNKLLTNSGKFPSNLYRIIPLHSMLPTAMQRSIFDSPPQGVRKIVIATNIAETSITINDVVYVINSGKIKIKNFDIENNISTLNEEWVSLANSKQRKGRAGRVQEGECYHLYARPRELLLDSYQLPELLRTRLEEVILQAKILRLGKVGSFLQKVIDPPDPKALELSLKLLIAMKALDTDEQLTPLGYHLAQLPVDPQAGKMILFASMFSCIDPVTSIAASISFKDAFVIPISQVKEAHQRKVDLSRGTKSDHMVMAYVMEDWREASRHHQGRRFANENYLAHPTLELLRDMKKQFTQHLHEMKFLGSRDVLSRESNVHSDNVALIKAIVCAGLYPNIAVIMAKPRIVKDNLVITKIQTDEDGKVFLHPKSINWSCPEYESPFLAYYLKLRSKCINLHDTTMVFPLALIFFSHSFYMSRRDNVAVFEINGLIRFSCMTGTALLIVELRSWLDYLLEQKASDPGVTDWRVDTDETLILKAIVELITMERSLYMPPQVEDDDPDFSDEEYLANY